MTISPPPTDEAREAARKIVSGEAFFRVDGKTNEDWWAFYEVVLTIARALLSTPPPQSGWRDMDGAPKDGTHILIYCKHWTHSVVAYYVEDYDNGRAVWMIHACEDDPFYASYTPLDEPTHWQPLPLPPVGTEEE